MSLTDFEWEILEECAGLREPRPWGAAVGAAYEFLVSQGIVRQGQVTDKGFRALKARTSYSQPKGEVGNGGEKR